MNVLVTGGAGFIGSHVCEALLDRGHSVVCVDDLSAGHLGNVAQLGNMPRFRFVYGSVTEMDALLEARTARRIDVVVHLASKKIPRYGGAREMLVDNVRGGEAAAEIARACEAKLVLASTSDVYGAGTALPFKEDGPLTLGSPLVARWGYAASKIWNEQLAFAYAAEFGLRVTVLRFFGAYGPRQHLSWWGGPQGVFLEALARGEPLEIHGDGLQSRSFIFIADLVEATARAIESAAADGEVINVGRSEEVTILELARRMAAAAGVEEPQFRFVPYSSFPGRYEDVRRRTAEVTKLRGLLGFVAATSLDDGLAQLWSWYRSRDAAPLPARQVAWG